MFDHVSIRASDAAASHAFYDTVLATLGIDPAWTHDEWRLWRDFTLAPADADHPVTRGLHLGFAAPSRAHVDEFWRVGVEAGYDDAGKPGPRPQYGGDYYGGFLHDPDGNSVEAVHHGSLRRGGRIDHLWIRVADVAASRRFYGLVGEHAGFALRRETAQRVQFTSGNGSFSVVAAGVEVMGHAAGATEHVHIAFPAPHDAVVRAFHRALTAAGYEDNGAPGERPHYHPGYYGAFVLDPDGHNVELVCHNPR